MNELVDQQILNYTMYRNSICLKRNVVILFVMDINKLIVLPKTLIVLPALLHPHLLLHCVQNASFSTIMFCCIPVVLKVRKKRLRNPSSIQYRVNTKKMAQRIEYVILNPLSCIALNII